jgi:hypothetical protein
MAVSEYEQTKGLACPNQKDALSACATRHA